MEVGFGVVFAGGVLAALPDVSLMGLMILLVAVVAGVVLTDLGVDVILKVVAVGVGLKLFRAAQYLFNANLNPLKLKEERVDFVEYFKLTER